MSPVSVQQAIHHQHLVCIDSAGVVHLLVFDTDLQDAVLVSQYYGQHVYHFVFHHNHIQCIPLFFQHPHDTDSDQKTPPCCTPH